ncbi:FecR family protein [Chitinophaga sp. S165]|uniref:FecR family protein n=1 Tax=Chitinophaga sp. S165 TaxID=2135462 RepID=UPI000D70F21B|nr:FecR domain-containing protein [Chitinophaga sp. S165]PWV46534.1 FecR family protein [Chitinophaga sp. S165]
MKQPDEHIITSLLEKHALGICTPEERALLEQWYAAFPENGQVWRDGQERSAMKDALKAGIFDVISSDEIHSITPVTVKSRRIWWQAAATVALLVATFLMYKKYSNKEEPAYVVLEAPAGKGAMRLQMPDQSEIWLEPGTTIRYPKDFGKAGREIELTDGMAFFSVPQQTEHPFIVNVPGRVQTKVLGTEFTIKAYRQLTSMQVFVSSGAVQVSDSKHLLGTVKAGEQLSYRPDTHIITPIEVKMADWRKGNISLNNATFAEVARMLENYYSLQVVFNEADVAAYRFNLRISSQSSAQEVLEVLHDISGLKYTLNNGKVTIH